MEHWGGVTILPLLPCLGVGDSNSGFPRFIMRARLEGGFVVERTEIYGKLKLLFILQGCCEVHLRLGTEPHQGRAVSG